MKPFEALAPMGKLRVGVFAGSPTSYLAPAAGAEARGVGFDLGRELASRMGVAFEPVVFPGNAPLLDAVRAGGVDLVLTNASEERKRFIDFSGTVLHIEKSYLVPAGSRIAEASAVDREGVKVGVSRGSTSQSELARELRHATLVPAASIEEGREMLADGRVDAFGTNNAILHEMGDRLPGSRVLPGCWGLEAFALGVPKGREAGHGYLREFARSIRGDGTVARAAQRAGLRGTVEVK